MGRALPPERGLPSWEVWWQRLVKLTAPFSQRVQHPTPDLFLAGTIRFNAPVAMFYRGATSPILKAPKQVVFLVSLILAVVAWISVFAGIPYIGGHPSVLLTLAYVVLALGCFL